MGNRPVALVCPLDWGIGHATRCVPVIKALIDNGFEPVIAASGKPLQFMKGEFPGIRTVDFPGVTVVYPDRGGMVLPMLRLAPKFFAGILREHRILKRLVSETGASLVVSDNRYGCWHKQVLSVFLTHQLDIALPPKWRWLRKLLRGLNNRFIRRYHECWIPDFELHRGLAGALSHPPTIPANAHYIGILSRFSEENARPGQTFDRPFDLLVMLSGPEPQRTILEEKILKQLAGLELRSAILRGLPGNGGERVIDGRIHIFPHLPTGRLRELILKSEIVLCRSGYSSIMDLVTLGKSAILIPTPGQTEQEYLARYLMDKKIYLSANQDGFELLFALELVKNFPGMTIRNDLKELETRIRTLKGEG